jgi:hypothetical protein
MVLNKYSRQSFLGNQDIFEQCIVGIVGLGGGGSHIVQQLAHIGFSDFRIFDPDKIEDSNLNRLIGANVQDTSNATPKTVIAARTIQSVIPSANIRIYPCKWQEEAYALKECNIIFGCVDKYAERRELEICSRRYLIPYIDIGMDVFCIGKDPPRMVGQVILSMPGGPCMFCLGFLTEEKLAQEASKYGNAGPRPQVVWPNGILASTAVGIAVDLLTDWTCSLRKFVYLSYDGNNLTLIPRMISKSVIKNTCPHYIINDLGDPVPSN